MKKKILCMVGTRPEVIKMAPVILALHQTAWAEVRVCATAQHRDMLDEALATFGIVPDIDLNAMRTNQSLASLTARLLTSIDEVLEAEQPHMVLVQGDTTTVLTSALACFYRRIPFAHVEAGLRTGDMQNPFPEEMNRIVASHLAHLNFAPTEGAKTALLAEGCSPSTIHVTGNTVIDAMLWVAAQQPKHGLDLPVNRRLVLLTAHRRESFGAPLHEIFRAIQTLTQLFPELHVIYPVHPNPNVREPAHALLSNNPSVTLCAPLDYRKLVALLQSVDFVLTDSGGIQEEAPALGKPVLVLRSETERPEAVAAGVAKLVGTDHDSIVLAATQLISDPSTYRQMAQGGSPYGDGHASERIITVLERFANCEKFCEQIRAS